MFRRKKSPVKEKKEQTDQGVIIQAMVGVGEILKNFYPITPPFAYVAIVSSIETGRLEYRVIEPPLTREDVENISEIKRLLLETTKISLKELRSGAREELLRNEIIRIVKKYKVPVDPTALDKIIYYIRRDMLGYGKIDVMMKDVNIEDISCDGINTPVYVWHRIYESLPSNIVFESPDELESLLVKMAYRAGKQISIAQPIVESSLPEGFRIHLTLSEISRRGGTFTIRKFREVPFSIVDLIKLGTVSTELAAYLWLIIEEKLSTMIVGATASGKTTMLNAVATFIRPEAKIVTIEDTPELNLPHENWVPLLTRPSYEEWVRNVDLFELLRSALRMRPDYIIVGEVRGAEAFTLYQAIATGHSGLCTMHAENVDYAVKRLLSKPMEVPLFLLPLMNVYMTIRRLKKDDKIVRRIVEVYEATGVDLEKRSLTLNKIFIYDPDKDTTEMTGESFLLKKIADEKFVTLEEVKAELARRRRVVEYLVEKNVVNFEKVSRIVRDYYRRPVEVYQMMETGAYELA